VLIIILKDIGIASRGDARPNVSSMVISTHRPGTRSDISKSYLLLDDDDGGDDMLVLLVLFVVVSLLQSVFLLL
jgi:hypothetical protein